MLGKGLLKNLGARMTYANVMATVAVFLALGGGAWALSRNSVGPRQIQPNAVRSSDVKNKTLRGIDLGGNAIDGSKVAPDSLTGLDVNERTLRGIGPSPLTGLTYFTFVSQNNSDSPKTVLGRCPEEDGKRVYFQGARIIGGDSGTPPNMTSNVALTESTVTHVLTGDWASAKAYEISPTTQNWQLILWTWCIDG